MVTPFALGDVVTLRKQHPCGGFKWRIERLGADIGIRCLICSHYLMLTRQRLERGVKHRESKAEPAQGES